MEETIGKKYDPLWHPLHISIFFSLLTTLLFITSFSDGQFEASIEFVALVIITVVSLIYGVTLTRLPKELVILDGERITITATGLEIELCDIEKAYGGPSFFLLTRTPIILYIKLKTGKEIKQLFVGDANTVGFRINQILSSDAATPE